MADLHKTLDSLEEYLLSEKERGAVYLSTEGIEKTKNEPVVAKEHIKSTGISACPEQVPAIEEHESKESMSDLSSIAKSVAKCKKCSLHETRTNVVPGQGNSKPEIMFVGEAPGADEDKQGLAFVGRAGKLLTKMIEAMGYERDEVFIGNILKCRPPNNRPPLPEEMDTCMPYLKEQIRLLKPKVIIALGATSAKGLLQTSEGISKLRGKWAEFEGIPLMPTYHPAYLLRNPSAKKFVWADLVEVLDSLGKKPPERKK